MSAPTVYSLIALVIGVAAMIALWSYIGFDSLLAAPIFASAAVLGIAIVSARRLST